MVVPEKDHPKFWPQKKSSVLQKLRCHGWNLPSDTNFGTYDVLYAFSELCVLVSTKFSFLHCTDFTVKRFLSAVSTQI